MPYMFTQEWVYLLPYSSLDTHRHHRHKQRNRQEAQWQPEQPGEVETLIL